MKNIDFKTELDAATIFMDPYFHVRLKGVGYKGNARNEMKDELMLRTTIKVWKAIDRGQLNGNYDTETLFKLNMKDVWSDFKKDYQKSPKLEDVDDFEFESTDPSPFDLMVINEAVRDILAQFDDDTNQLLIMHAEGHSYDDISKIQKTSPEALKQKVYRIRRMFGGNNDSSI